MALPWHGPGKPISTHGMTQKLNRHDTPVRTARNGALAALAADLPSPILADVTGMHCHTALRWVAYARRDWAEYLAARAEEVISNRSQLSRDRLRGDLRWRHWRRIGAENMN